MRIICTVTNDLSHDQRMHRICSTLVDAGHDVLLVGRQLPQSPPLVKRNFEQLRLACRFHSGKLFYLEYNYRLWRLMSARNFEVINAVDLDTLLPAFLISKSKKCEIVYDAHEYFTETPEVTRRKIVQATWRLLARWIIPRLKYAYTVGGALADILSRRYGIPFGLVRNVPLRKARKQVDKHSPKVLLYQGMLNEGRGLETVMEAMKILPNHVLWLVGNGDIKAKLEQLAVDYKIEDRVHFWGFIPPAQLPDINQKAFLGLNLFEKRSLNYYYSLANKAFDYIQAGLPSIHMDFPEYQRLQEQYDTFLLLPALESNPLAEIIKQITDDRERYEQLQENCFAAAKELCWEREREKLLLFWSQIEIDDRSSK